MTACYKSDKIMKDLILGHTKDCVRDLLYYDRKECEDLSVGAIQEAVKNGELTKEDIVEAFREELDEWWE